MANYETSIVDRPQSPVFVDNEMFETASDVLHHSPSTPSLSPQRSGQQSPVTAEKTFLRRIFTSAFPEGPQLTHKLDQKTDVLTAVGIDVGSNVSDACQHIAAAATTFSSMASTVTATSSQISDFIETVRGIVSKVPELADYVQRICDGIAMVIDIIIALINKSVASVPTLIYRLLSLFGVAHDLIQICIMKFSGYFLAHEANQPERATMMPQGSSLTGLPSLLTECVGMFFLKRMPTDSELKSVNDKLRFTEMFRREVATTYDSILAFIRSLPSVCKEWAAIVMPLNWWLNLFAPNTVYYNWLNEVESLHTRSVEEALTYDQELQEKVRRLHKEGIQMIKDLATSGPEFNRVFQLLKDKFKYLDDLYEEVDASGYTRNARPVPFVVYMYGLPGQGKSFLTSVLPSILARAPPETPNISWSRNAGIAHWDGYTGQFCVVYDDFDATRSLNVAPGEHAELMSIVSNEQYRLPMASLEKKGEVFRSKVVLISSNNPFPAPNTINHREALWRRRHAMYCISVRPEFRKVGSPEVDPAKIPADNSHYQIRKVLNPVREDSALTEFMTYDQFIHDVKTSYMRHQVEQREAMTASKRMITESLERDRAFPQGALLDLVDSLQHFVHRERSFADEIRARLRLLFPSEMPKWLKAALTGAALMSGAVAILQIAKMMFAGNTTLEAETVVFNIHRYYYSNGQFLPEGAHSDLRALCKTALSGFKDLLSEKEIETILDKYCPEGAYHGVRNMQPPPRVMRLEGKDRRDHDRAGFRRRSLTTALNHTRNVMTPEGQRDPNAMSVVHHCIYENLVTVASKGNSMHALFVVGRVMMLPRHFFHNNKGEPLEQGELFHVLWYENVFMEAYDPKRRVDINGDTVLYNCSANVVAFKDIRKHFIKDADLGTKSRFPALLCLFSRGIPYIQQLDIQRSTRPIEVPFDLTFQYSAEDRGNVIEKHQGWVYEAQTEPGACGGPLVVMDTSVVRKIVGIHVAATPAKSFAAAMLVTQEMIESGFIKFPPMVLNPGLLPAGIIESVTDDMMVPQGNFSILGKLAKKIHSPIKSKIVPSLIHGKIFEPVTAPSVLHPRDPRLIDPVSPFRQGVEKYGRVAPIIDQTIVAAIRNHFLDWFSDWDMEMDRKVASERVAINGVKGLEHCLPLPMDTSPGYPYNQRERIRMQNEVGKVWLFEGGPGNWMINDSELRMAVDARIALGKRGMRPKSLWLDCLKDERRSLEKISQGKTRVFTIPPVDFTIVFRMYTISFTTNFIANNKKFFSAVGIDPESSDWTQLMKYLESNSDLGFAGDYSGWDGNISPIMIEECANLVNAWYADSDENQLLRKVLFDEIAHTPQAFLTTAYMTHIGNPSGNPLTAIMNTIVNAMYLRYCWMKLAPAEFRSLASFEENVRDKILGDDNIISVRPQVREFYNPDTLAEELAKLNLTYTSATKDGKAEWLPIEKLTFLKRGFRKGDYGLWLPLMDKKTIQELTNWIRLSDFKTEEEMTLDNCNEALRFAFFYGLDYFKELRSKIVPLLRQKHIVKDWDYFYSWFYEVQTRETGWVMKLVDLRRARDNATLQVTNETDSPKAEDPKATRKYKSSELLKYLCSKVSQTKPALEATMKELYEKTPQASRSDAILMMPQADAVRNLANAKGIISITQRSAEQDDGSAEPMAKNEKLAAECMSDPPWTLSEMAKRRVWIDTYAWTTSQTFQTVITKLTAPWDFLKNYLQQAPFERYLFYNGSMRLRIHVNGTRFHAGRLIAGFVPWTRSSVTSEWHEKNMAAMWGIPNVVLDATANNEAILDIPFYNPKSFLVLSGPYDQDVDFTGTFILQVLAPLRAATGSSPTINVNVWVEFNTDSQFRIPLHTAQTGRAFNEEHYRQVQHRAIRMTPQGNSMSNTTNVNNYGTIDGMTVPSEMTGDSIGNGNSASGIPMDKPGYMANPIPVRLKAMQNLASTVGTELVTRLDLDPSQQNLSISEMFGTETDEMEMKFLVTRPTYQTTVSWTTTNAVGDSLAAFWMGPMSSLFQNGSQAQIAMVEGSTIPMTQWEYVCKGFRFWRGSLKVRFDIVATQFHTGRLFFALNYGAPPDSETGLRDATSQYGVEIDIQNEKHTFEFNIPYNAATPWMEVCRGPKGAEENANFWWMKYFLGSWNLRVLNALAVSENVTNSVDILISISGGDDFVLYYPSFNNACFTGQTANQASLRDDDDRIRMIPQGDNGMAGEDAVAVPTTTEGQEENGIPVAPPGAKVKFPHSHFGPKAGISHVGSFIKRYHAMPAAAMDQAQYLSYVKSGMIGQAGIANDIAGFTNVFTPTTPATSPTQWVGWISLPLETIMYNYGMVRDFALMYRFWRGALRFKVYWQDLADYKNVPLQVSSYGVTYFPGTPNTSAGNANWALIASTLACTTDFTLNLTTGSTFDGRAIPFLASDMALNIAPYSEVEVPFTSVYNVMATPYNNVNALADENRFPGWLVIYYRFSYSSVADDVTSLQTNGISGLPKILFAAGDDFRLGTFKGVPMITAHNVYNPGTALGATGPVDTWIITQPSTPSNELWDVVEKEPTTRKKEDVMTQSMIAEAMEIVSKNRLRMLPQGSTDPPLMRFVARTGTEQHKFCLCWDPELMARSSLADQNHLPHSMKYINSLLLFLTANLTQECDFPVHASLEVFQGVVNKFGVQYNISIEPDPKVTNTLWIGGEWQFSTSALRPRYTIPTYIKAHPWGVEAAVREMNLRILSDILIRAQMIAAAFYQVPLMLPCYSPEQRHRASQGAMPTDLFQPFLVDGEAKLYELYSMKNPLVMTPQVGNSLSSFPTTVTLFTNFLERSAENARVRLNELKGICGLDLDHTYIPIGPDNDRTWELTIEVAQSPFAELLGLKGAGEGRTKSAAAEKASDDLVPKLIGAMSVLISEWRTNEDIREAAEFNKRYPLKDSVEESDARVTATASKAKRLAVKWLDVEKSDSKSVELESSLPEPITFAPKVESSRRAELETSALIGRLEEVRQAILADDDLWNSFRCRGLKGAFRVIAHHSIGFNVTIDEVALRVYQLKVHLISHEHDSSHQSFESAYVYAGLDDDDVWGRVIGTTLLKTLGNIIDEKKSGWTTVNFYK